MSTCAAALLLASLALADQAGCSSAGASGDQTLELTPDPPTVLAPSQQGSVGFLLESHGRPAGGRTVSFAIVPSDPKGAQGATLAANSGTTDASGHVTVAIRAGMATEFQVRAQSASAIAEATVVVQAGSFGNLLIAPFFAPMSQAAQRAKSIQVFLYDGGSCAAIPPEDPPVPSRSPPAIPVGQTGVPIQGVSTDSPSAAFAQALGPGSAVLATGCVDVPGSSVQPGLTVKVSLPLIDTVFDPVGTFTVTSTLTFAPPLAAAATLAAPWANLADCPLDPAQLWLDCTVDALSPATAGDPLDCLPAPGPGAEGAVGDAITARRGAFLVDGTGVATACRGATASGGGEGLDALVLGLFGAPAPAAITNLPGVAADAASILQSIRLISSLDVEPGTQAGSYVVTHTLQDAEFGGPAWSASVALAPLGLPVLQAVTSATIERESLVIAQHGFTLRLGTTARAAFGPLALVPRGFPPDVPGFVQALFTAARSPGGAAKGCAALDATVCPAIGQPAGCVSAACATGLTALASILDNAFLAADGPDLDLRLEGTAPMVPVPGGLRAQRLGIGEASSPGAAKWNAQVVTSQGTATLRPPFEGLRN